MASEVDAGEAEPAGDRDVLRREVDEEGAPAVGAGRVALDEREQLLAHDDARDPAGMERTRGGPGEHVDVGEHRDRELLTRDPADELVVLAGVPADLVDHEARPGLDLLLQLEVLRHHLALVTLVVRDGAAEEEVGAIEALAGRAVVGEALVHLGEQAEQARPSRCRTPAPRSRRDR